MMAWRRVSVASSVLAVFLFAAPAASAADSAQAVAFLNAQRAANGIPGDLVNDPNLELGCRQHNRYMEANGALGHGENPASPYYTPEGGAEEPWAYRGEVLSYGGYEPDGWNPWEWAPIHLYLMLDPERTTAGYDSAKYTCMRLGGQRHPGGLEPSFFSYPGPGTVGIYPEERAYESPYVPQQLVGIPEGAATGPNILLFSTGTRELDAVSFGITGPGGSVAARMVDANTQSEVGDGGWFDGGGVLIPEQPLVPYTTYEVSVLWKNLSFGEAPEGGSPGSTEFLAQRFTFTTGSERVEKEEEAPPTRTPALSLHRLANADERVRFRLRADPMLIGRSARIIVYRHEKGCGKAFASSAGPCGWRSLVDPKRWALVLRRSQVVSAKDPTRWERVTIKVRTRGFVLSGVSIVPALARAMAWGDR